MSKPIQKYMTPMPHSVGHNMTLDKAKSIMKENACHHLPVLEGGKLVGIISDRDIRAFEKIKTENKLNVEDVMTNEPVIVDRNQDIFQVAMLMHQRKIGSVIISASESSPWGIFTATDALAYFTNKP